MKTSTFTQIIAVVALSLVVAANADPCYDLTPGQPCTNAQGQNSRCSHRSVCIENLKECPSGSTLLQSCSTTSEKYCFPLFEGKPLQCLDDVNIETTVQRDVCIGKSDDTPCKNAFTEGNGKAGLTATVYEQDGVCEESYCMPTIFSVCNNRPIGATCTDTAVLGGKRRSFTGNCKAEEPFRPWCKSDSNGVVLGDAKILVAPAAGSTTTAPPSSTTTTPTTTTTTPSPSKTKSSTPAPSRSSGSRSSSDKTLDEMLEELEAQLSATRAPTTSSPPRTTPPPASASASLSTSAVLTLVSATAAMLLTLLIMDLQDLLDEVEEAIQDRPSGRAKPSYSSSSANSTYSTSSSSSRRDDSSYYPRSNTSSSTTKKTVDDIDDILNMIDGNDDDDSTATARVHPHRGSSSTTSPTSTTTSSSNYKPASASRPEEFKASGGSKKCSTLMVGGESAKRGVNTAFASQSVCANLRCNDCDFTVVQFLGKKWSASADYMFFRENVPNEAKLRARMESSHDSAAYACQCKWLSIDVPTRADMCRVKWSCAGH